MNFEKKQILKIKIFNNDTVPAGFPVHKMEMAGRVFLKWWVANLLVSFPDIRIWFRNARQIPPRRATACNTQEKTAGGRWGILNKKVSWHWRDALFPRTITRSHMDAKRQKFLIVVGS